jgi:hypothetical protein
VSLAAVESVYVVDDVFATNPVTVPSELPR